MNVSASRSPCASNRRMSTLPLNRPFGGPSSARPQLMTVIVSSQGLAELVPPTRFLVPMRIEPLNVNASHEPGGGRNPNPAHEPSGSWVQCAKTKGSWRSNLNPNRRRGLRLRLRLRLRLGAEEGYTHSEGRSRGGAYASTLGRLECGPCTEAARAGACSVPRSAWSACLPKPRRRQACASAPLWNGNARMTVLGKRRSTAALQTLRHLGAELSRGD